MIRFVLLIPKSLTIKKLVNYLSKFVKSSVSLKDPINASISSFKAI